MLHRLLKRKAVGDSRSENIWLTVYADLVTTLTLVFMVLYGLTMIGDEALMKAVQSMKIEDFYNSEFDTLAPILRKNLEKQSDVFISEEAGAVRIEFGNKLLFGSGFADLKPTADPLLGKIAELIKTAPYTIVVEGHTDNIPLANKSRYKDNWELSLARSMSVVRFLKEKAGIPPGQLSAAAYGSNRPRASNQTPAGRAINRRVEVALMKDFPYEL